MQIRALPVSSPFHAISWTEYQPPASAPPPNRLPLCSFLGRLCVFGYLVPQSCDPVPRVHAALLSTSPHQLLGLHAPKTRTMTLAQGPGSWCWPDARPSIRNQMSRRNGDICPRSHCRLPLGLERVACKRIQQLCGVASGLAQ